MTIKDTIGAVEKFHDAFGIKNNHEPTAVISEADYTLRHKLMAEENEEYLDNAKDDLIEIADLVTEMELLKHPFRAGIKAQIGVSWIYFCCCKY